MADLSGKWVGYYEYGLGYDLPYFGQRVKCSMEIIVKDGLIKGTVTEEESEFSVSSGSTVSGFIENNLVSFVNKYPVSPQINNKNQVVIKTGELEVNYSGNLDLEKMTMFGLWTIEAYETSPYDINNPIQSEGIWLFKKLH